MKNSQRGSALIIILVLALVVIAGGVYFYSQKSQTERGTEIENTLVSFNLTGVFKGVKVTLAQNEGGLYSHVDDSSVKNKLGISHIGFHLSDDSGNGTPGATFEKIDERTYIWKNPDGTYVGWVTQGKPAGDDAGTARSLTRMKIVVENGKYTISDIKQLASPNDVNF